ncbi:MAG: hypothetical protein ABTQ27_07925 [Amaricoccus sp.]|uniref:hypothetical protein n=1 Tax=Amaricoccus sp. TaxID=1872485 RepID=UPI003315D487
MDWLKRQRRRITATPSSLSARNLDPAEKARADQLQAEYLHLQKTIEEFDAKSLTIKAWSATLTTAGIAAAYTQNAPPVLLITAGGGLVFWLIEIAWKVSQDAYYPRVEMIERCFRDQRFDQAPFQISAWWPAPFGAQAARVVRALYLPRVFLPHLVVALAGLCLYFAAESHPAPMLSRPATFDEVR